jgi:hypothetical protein
MVAGKRLKRLREMVDHIERLPESPERDRLLNEVRSRAVDVDTGDTPRAMLSMREPVEPWAPKPVRARPPKRDVVRGMMWPAASPPTSPAPRAPAAGPAENADVSFCIDERLSLDDSPQRLSLPYLRGRGGQAIAPWRLGLRG